MPGPWRDTNGSGLLIAQVDVAQNESGGDFYYRTYAPGVGMAHCADTYVINMVNIHRLKHEVMREADVLVLNNICDADVLPIARARKAEGKLTVFELCDDLEDIPLSSPVRAFYAQSKNMLLIKRLAHYCDVLQFSSPELKRKYGYLNERTVVFPNHVLEIPPEINRGAGDKLIVGWGGSAGHLRDIARISGRLIEWVMSRSDVHLYLMCAENILDLFKKLPAKRKKHFPPGSMRDYHDFLTHLDIGIAPLEDTPFNRSRSDVKFLEYAAHGVVPVVQATGPYLLSVENGKTGLFFRTTDELIAKLDYLLADKSARKTMSANAREYVLRERNQLDRGLDRVNFYRGLIRQRERAEGPNGGRVPDAFTRLSRYPGAVMKDRHLYLSATRFELLLQAGVVSSDPNCPSRSWSLFREAIQTEPASYLPYLLGASVSGDPARMLQKAIEMNPESIVSRLHLGMAYTSKEMFVEAVKSFEEAARIFPEYELPYIECANVLNRIGLKQEAVELMKKAIEVIPAVIRNGPATGPQCPVP